jgi:hypothetical protein
VSKQLGISRVVLSSMESVIISSGGGGGGGDSIGSRNDACYLKFQRRVVG